MRVAHAATVLGLLLAAASAGSTQTTKPNADPLAPIAWMVGTWQGEVASPNGGALQKIETGIRRVLGGKAMAFETSFNGVRQYEGHFGYDAGRKNIVFAYASADGGWVDGTVQPVADYLLWDFTVHESNGSSGHYQVHVQPQGPNDYLWALFTPKGSDWAELFHVKYHRLASE